VEALRPFQERFAEYVADPAALDEVLADGADRAREMADSTLERVFDRFGLVRQRRHRS
jgi:tryptophanyl-tRNA synthetase